MNAIRKYWSTFVAFSAALMSLFSGFLVAVPETSGENPWYKYGKFLVAVCIGLWFVPEHTWNLRKHKWAWWTSAIVLVIFSSGFIVGYTKLVNSWSVLYFRDQRIIVGKTLTSAGEEDQQLLRISGRTPSDLELLQRVLGDAKRVWDPDEIESRQFKLTLVYLATLFLLSSSVVTVAQAAYCSTREH
jgi:hypothetical protein